MMLSFPCIDLYTSPLSYNISVGENATFECYGRGSYLYWFINSVNTENMTETERSGIGMNFSGDYNQVSDFPYSGECNYQHSYMTLPGNCLNNNSEIYCIIIGRSSGFKKSDVANFKVEGIIIFQTMT